MSVVPSQLLGFSRIKERIDQLQAQKDARMARKEISKEALVEKFWEFVHDPTSKKGEATQAGIAIAKMVGWNAPQRIEHDLGDRVRAYLEDIRARPLRPAVMIQRYESGSEQPVLEGYVVDDKRVKP